MINYILDIRVHGLIKFKLPYTIIHTGWMGTIIRATNLLINYNVHACKIRFVLLKMENIRKSHTQGCTFSRFRHFLLHF